MILHDPLLLDLAFGSVGVVRCALLILSGALGHELLVDVVILAEEFVSVVGEIWVV